MARRAKSGPSGPVKDDRSDPSNAEASEPSFEEKYPNLAAQEDLDRAQHVKAAEDMGATRKQAVRHANEEVGAH